MPTVTAADADEHVAPLHWEADVLLRDGRTAHIRPIRPDDADLLVDYADALQHSCEPSAALEKINQAIALNPLGPDRYWWTAGGASFHLQRYRDAIDAMSHMQDPSPAFRLLAASWAMLGERQKAAEYVRKATEIHPDFSVNGWLSILPIRDPAFAQHYEQGLREAGFE